MRRVRPRVRLGAQPVGCGRAGCLPPLRGGALRCSPHRLARRNSLRSLRELRSDNRRENDGRCALRAPPVRLRFSAAHKARRRPTGCAPKRTLVRTPRKRWRSVVVWNAAAAGFATTRLVSQSGRRDPGPMWRKACAAHRVPSAAPSSAVSGSARVARFVHHSCGALFERSERSERSELRRTTPRRAAQGSRCEAPTVAAGARCAAHALRHIGPGSLRPDCETRRVVATRNAALEWRGVTARPAPASRGASDCPPAACAAVRRPARCAG